MSHIKVFFIAKIKNLNKEYKQKNKELIDIAKQSGNRYLYTGLGYHHHGIYKSLKKGFEWWTGREWSKDIPLYVHLCNKDDEIKTIDELHQHQLDYFEENDV